jgi:hypothetical protein
MLPLSPSSADLRFRTVDLCNTTGLTFFYFEWSLYRIHSHIARSPTALETYQDLPEAVRATIVWAYVPISPNDRITQFGVRHSGSWLFPHLPSFSEPAVLVSYAQGIRNLAAKSIRDGILESIHAILEKTLGSFIFMP